MVVGLLDRRPSAYTRETPIHRIHIPRTGGTALQHALRGSGILDGGHATRLSSVKPHEKAIVIVRDPIERFVSCFWWVRSATKAWHNPDALARNLWGEQELDTIRDTFIFQPLTYWLDTNRRLLWVGRTETLTDDFLRLRLRLGLGDDFQLPPDDDILVNNSHAKVSDTTPLSEQAIENLRLWYADDYAWLSGQGMPPP